MIMVNWLINGMKYNSLIRWTMWLAQTFKPADKVYLFVAPRSAWKKIYICVVFVYLQKQEMSLFKVGLCRLSWQTYFKYWLLVTVQKWMFYHRLGITVFFMVFHPCHTFSNWFNVVPWSVRLQFSLFLRPFHLLVLLFLFISIVCYPIFDFLIHSFIYLFAFQALLTFRPALAEVLQLTELGRKRGSGSNTCFFKPLVSAVLTNITQQVW